MNNQKDLAMKRKSRILLEPDTLIPEDFQKFDPAAEMLLNNKFSGIPLMNIKEFLFNTSPD